MQLIYINAGTIKRVVTSQRGSWRWQDAYCIAQYVPTLSRDKKKFLWKSIGQGLKFALTKENKNLPQKYGRGSMHNMTAIPSGVDDFGNLFFVVD